MKRMVSTVGRTRALLAAVLAMLFAGTLRAGELHEAAAAGDVNRMKALLEADPTLLESQDESGNTPLLTACQRRQLAAVNLLLDNNANIRARNYWGGTPVYFASRDLELCRRLVALGAEVNVPGYAGYTALHLAAAGGNFGVAEFLIGHGADLNYRSAVGTAVHRVILSRGETPLEMAKLLLESGARLQEFSFGNTELHLAALKGYVEIIPLLVKRGADVNAVNRYGHTPLYYAATHGHRKVAEALIAAGADKSVIVEANYGRAPQLHEQLKAGEAYLWYLSDSMPPLSGYAVKTKNHLLAFNPPWIDDSPESGLANGHLNPAELTGQKVTVLITQHFMNRLSASEMARRLSGARFVLSSQSAADGAATSGAPPYRLAVPHESLSAGGIQVHTIPTGRQINFAGETRGYLVEVDGLKIFHAGLHSAGNNSAAEVDAYRKEIDFLKPLGPIDIAILPVSGRHMQITYEPYLYLLDQLSPKAVYLNGDDLTTEEHLKCIRILQARNVPVFYPEGGLAVGERFHYVRRQGGKE